MSDNGIARSMRTEVAFAAGRKGQKLTAKGTVRSTTQAGAKADTAGHVDVLHLTDASLPQALASLTKADDGRPLAAR